MQSTNTSSIKSSIICNFCEKSGYTDSNCYTIKNKLLDVYNQFQIIETKTYQLMLMNLRSAKNIC